MTAFIHLYDRKTHLYDRVERGGGMRLTNYCRQTTKDRTLNFTVFFVCFFFVVVVFFFFCFFFKIIECIIQSIRINLEILRREPMKINDIGHNYNFIGDTLNYVTYVIS